MTPHVVVFGRRVPAMALAAAMPLVATAYAAMAVFVGTPTILGLGPSLAAVRADLDRRSDRSARRLMDAAEIEQRLKGYAELKQDLARYEAEIARLRVRGGRPRRDDLRGL